MPSPRNIQTSLNLEMRQHIALQLLYGLQSALICMRIGDLNARELEHVVSLATAAGSPGTAEA